MPSRSTRDKAGLLAIAAVAGWIASVAHAATVGQPVQVSPAGHVLAEFSAATAPGNPQSMVASAIDSDLPFMTRCAVYVSQDGGRTWSEVQVWSETPEINSRYDPWVAVGADGTFHAACIVRTELGSRVGYSQSTDQGRTWAAPRIVTPFPCDFRRHTADKSAFGVGADGAIHVCHNQITEPRQLTSELMVSRSDDRGLTWITRNTNAGNGYCNGVVAAPSGSVTVVYIMNNGSSTAPLLQYGTVTSADGGENWHAPVVLGDVPAVVLPSIVRDAAGRTVVAELAGQADAPHLDVTIQDDDGAVVQQWQLAQPASATCSNGRIIHPSLTAPPTGFPALQIGCKISPTDSAAGRQEVWLYTEIAGPGTTPPPVLVSSQELPAGTPPKDTFAARFPDGGDYWSLTWTEEGWLGMWIDARDAWGPGALWAAPVSAD